MRHRQAQAWLWLAALLGGGALLGWWLPANALDWQPDLAASQPWRAWTAAAVHWSALHLGANLAGLAVLAALGWVADLPRPAALAWACAWPMTHAGLLWRPELAHYGGLSGVLHAGVAVAALWLLLGPWHGAVGGNGRECRTGRAGRVGRVGRVGSDGRDGAAARTRRRMGAAMAAGLLLKILLERPWGETLQHPADWDIAIAPSAHATGALAGALCVAVALVLSRTLTRAAARRAGGPS